MAGQTVKQWLQDLSGRTDSSDHDSTMMQNLLHRVGFGNARVVVGVVYLKGHGTMDAPPASIHSIAKMLLTKAP